MKKKEMAALFDMSPATLDALQPLGEGVLVLALVHDEEVLDPATPIPSDPHDVAVHGAVTPTRWMFFRQP